MRRPSFMTALFSAFALALGTAPAYAGDIESYVRFATGDGPQDAALQTAKATFRHPTLDLEITLYGVVHIADADYYAKVQRDLDSYDVVLYEGVAPGSTEPTEEDKSLGDMQKIMGEMLGLTFQKDGIDYTRKNLVHADMNMDQLKEAMGGSSINPLGQVMGEDQLKSMAPMMKMFGQVGKMLMQSNPRMQDQFKLMMGKQLATADLSKAMPEKMSNAILIERNKVVMDVLEKQLTKTKQGTIAIFYGAAHNPDFEERLVALGYTKTSKSWMSAWQIGGGVDDGAAPAPAQAPKTRERETVPASPEGPRWF